MAVQGIALANHVCSGRFIAHLNCFVGVQCTIYFIKKLGNICPYICVNSVFEQYVVAEQCLLPSTMTDFLKIIYVHAQHSLQAWQV